jgi:hypothetical protein
VISVVGRSRIASSARVRARRLASVRNTGGAVSCGSELRQEMAGERVIHDGHGHARILPGAAEPPLTEDAVARDGLPDHGEAATMAP